VRLTAACLALLLTAAPCSSGSSTHRAPAAGRPTTSSTLAIKPLTVSIEDSFQPTDKEPLNVSLWDHYLAWSGGQNSDLIELRDLTAHSDPASLWVRRADGSDQPRKVVGPSQGNAVPGSTTIAYFVGPTGIFASSIAHPDQMTAVVPAGRSVPVRVDAFGDRVAWGTDTIEKSGDVTTKLFVGRISGG
jgi:hypothetical protein